MKEIEIFLDFIYDNIEDPRFDITKKMKYGCRYYYIDISISKSGNSGKEFISNLNICIDNRNNVVEFDFNYDKILYESEELVKKWSSILEEIYSKRMSDDMTSMITSFLSNADDRDKDLWRQWKINRLI